MKKTNKDNRTIARFWDMLHNQAEHDAGVLAQTTQHEYRTVRHPEGYSIDGFSPLTGKWYTVRIVREIRVDLGMV